MNLHARLSLLAVAMSCLPSVVEAAPPLRDLVDQHVQAARAQQQIAPAELCDDAEFLRRVYLDLLGLIPTPDEAVNFLDDESADKRGVLIARLLEHPRFAVHQSDIWDQVYFGRNPPGFGTREREGFQRWLQQQFRDNVPYDRWARQLLQAEGNTVEQGAPMFYVQYKNAPEDATQAVTQKFLGVQLQCARCHDHPFDQWTQQDFYGVAAFLARLEVVDVGTRNKQKAFEIGEKNLGDVLFTGPAAQQTPGKKGEPIQPKFLGAEALEEPSLPSDFKEPRNFPNGKSPPKPQFSRKDALANWIASKENPYFARAAANRIWAQFMGKGIVEPVDNLSPANPPSHPELLEALATSLAEHDFDLKWFIAELLNSQTYQLSSAGANAEAKPLWYERARYRPLSAEELLESWVIASGYDRVLEASKQDSPERLNVRGVTWGYLIGAFGEPNDGVGNFQGGLHEHLYLNNGQVRQLISDRPGSLHHALTQSDQSWEQRVEQLFLQTLSRRPSDDETKKFVEFLDSDQDPRGRLHDAIWTLLTCSEFRFNH
ncbi:MAG: DUF1549 domain-containing protein [Planctomycetales bacterium]|nr:DUF1549 domain-containing protein [Planctomycetales bacterium]